MSFDDQLALLEALPPVEGDAISSTKTLHYQLLNEMLSNSPTLIDNWGSLDKKQILSIVARCMEMSKCRDLNNKLRGALLNIKTHQFSLNDFHHLYALLADHGLLENQGAVDVKLINSLLMRRNLKTAANLTNASDPKEL